jgi:hypothetical protein
MRLAALLAIAALPLSACAQEDEGQAPETPVVESEAAPAAGDADLAPGEPSLADPAPGSITSPAPAANSATPAPGSVDAEEVGEQYQDFVGEQPAQ